MLDNNDLLCFLAVARTLNFTKAAQELFVSQQAVSQRISKIEQGLEFPLFTRSRNYVKLTAGGEKFLAFLAPAEQTYQELLNQCRQDYQRLSGTLRIGYQNMLNWDALLGASEEAFAAQNPDVQIIGELHDSFGLISKLKSGDLHMAICYDRFVPASESFERAVVLETPLLLMVSNRNPLSRENASYTDFRNEPWIEDIFGDEPPESCLNRAKKTASLLGLSPSNFVLVPNRDTANMAAEAGRGIIVGTKFGVASQSRNIRIYPTKIKERLVCLWNEGEEHPMVQQYISFLQRAHSQP